VRERSERRGRSLPATLRICVTCRWQGQDVLDDELIRPGQRLHDLVKAEAGPEKADRVQEIVCLTHCMNACNAVAMQRGKTPMLMTRMAPTLETARAMLEMLDRFDASEDGTVPDDQVPDAIPQARPLIPAGAMRSRNRS